MTYGGAIYFMMHQHNNRKYDLNSNYDLPRNKGYTSDMKPIPRNIK